jgi:hypothetical protein
MEATATKSMKAGAKLRRILEAFKPGAAKVTESPKVSTAENAMREGSGINEAIERSGDGAGKELRLDVTDDNLLHHINTHIEENVRTYRRYGDIDGKNGSRDYHVSVAAESQATHIVEYINSKLEGKIEGLSKEIEYKEQDLSTLTADHVSAKEHYNRLLAFAEAEPKSFHGLSAVMYILFGLGLMAADIPVSISLVGYLDIGHVGGDAPFMDKLQDIELMVFALGIALCSVYIKILYDEYISTKPPKTLFKVKSAAAMVAEERGSDRTSYYIKLGVKLLIFAGLLYMLYNLGHFRNGYSGMPDNLTVIQTIEPDILDYRFGSFMGITLIIPTISGICLSIGFTIVVNRRNIRKSRKLAAACFAKLEPVRRQLQAIHILKKQLAVYLVEWKNKVHKIVVISDQFVGGYEQAYKRAFEHAHGFDFYKMVEEFQKESMFQRMKHSIYPKTVIV